MGWCRRWVLRYSSTISNPAYRVPVPAGADVHRHRCCAAAPVCGENPAEYPENEYQCCRHLLVQVVGLAIYVRISRARDDQAPARPAHARVLVLPKCRPDNQ